MRKAIILAAAATAAIPLTASPAEARHWGHVYYGYAAYPYANPVYGYGYWPRHRHYLYFRSYYGYRFRHHWRRHYRWGWGD